MKQQLEQKIESLCAQIGAVEQEIDKGQKIGQDKLLAKLSDQIRTYYPEKPELTFRSGWVERRRSWKRGDAGHYIYWRMTCLCGEHYPFDLFDLSLEDDSWRLSCGSLNFTQGEDMTVIGVRGAMLLLIANLNVMDEIRTEAEEIYKSTEHLSEQLRSLHKELHDARTALKEIVDGEYRDDIQRRMDKREMVKLPQVKKAWYEYVEGKRVFHLDDVNGSIEFRKSQSDRFLICGYEILGTKTGRTFDLSLLLPSGHTYQVNGVLRDKVVELVETAKLFEEKTCHDINANAVKRYEEWNSEIDGE